MMINMLFPSPVLSYGLIAGLNLQSPRDRLRFFCEMHHYFPLSQGRFHFCDCDYYYCFGLYDSDY
eukprot:UN31912